MRVFLLFAFLAVLVTAVTAWEKEDHEIFDLVSALEAAEGKGTTFYSWLDVPHTASTSEILKAYRKKSVALHPDKNPGVKHAHERFSRLGVIMAILKDKESRKRYDFFHKNGVPKWRGTGYYYSRFRPGLGTVLVFLTMLTSGLQYLVQKMNYKRDLDRIEWITQQARSAAWGTRSTTPPEGKRKVKVPLGGSVRYDEDGNLIPGRMVDMVVDGNDVFILEAGGNLIPVNASTATMPSIKRTWFLALAGILYTKAVKRSGLQSETSDREGENKDLDGSEDGDSTSTHDAPGSGSVTPKDDGASPPKGGKASRAAATIAGGRRRKGIKKR